MKKLLVNNLHHYEFILTWNIRTGIHFKSIVFVDEFVPTEASYLYPQEFNHFKSTANSFFFVVQGLINKLMFQKLWVLSQFWSIWINSFLANVPIRFHAIPSGKKFEQEEISAKEKNAEFKTPQRFDSTWLIAQINSAKLDHFK